MGSAEKVLLAVARFVEAGCHIRCGARRIREGDTEREDVEALLWRATLTSPRYISLEPALERIFCSVSPPLARTDLFAPLPPRRVPTIPVLDVLLPHSCTRSRTLRRRCSTGRWNTRGLIQIIGLPSYPGPRSLFFCFPFPPVFLFLLYLAASFLYRTSFSCVLRQPIISLIYRIPVYLCIYLSLFLLYTRCAYLFHYSVICVCTLKSFITRIYEIRALMSKNKI